MAPPGTIGSIVRPYGDTTGDGMVQTSFTLPVPPVRRPRAPRCSWPTRWASSPRWSCTATPSTAATRSSSSTAACGTWSTSTPSSSRSAPTRCCRPSEINGAIRSRLNRKMVVLGACIGTDAHTVGIDAILNVKGFAGEKGLEYLPRDGRDESRRPGDGARARRPGPGRPRRRRPRVPGGHPEGRAPAQHPRAGRRLPRGDGGVRPLLVVGGPRFDPAMAADLGVDKVFGRGTTPGEVASYLIHALVPEGSPHDRVRPRLGLTVTHRRYVPYAHAHYGGSLVDGAYTLGLFGDVATEVAIRMDGDEGPARRLLGGPLPRAGARRRRPGGDRRGRSDRPPQPGAALHRPGRRPRRARARPVGGPRARPPETVVEATATLVVPGPDRAAPSRRRKPPHSGAHSRRCPCASASCRQHAPVLRSGLRPTLEYGRAVAAPGEPPLTTPTRSSPTPDRARLRSLRSDRGPRPHRVAGRHPRPPGRPMTRPLRAGASAPAAGRPSCGPGPASGAERA